MEGLRGEKRALSGDLAAAQARALEAAESERAALEALGTSKRQAASMGAALTVRVWGLKRGGPLERRTSREEERPLPPPPVITLVLSAYREPVMS